MKIYILTGKRPGIAGNYSIISFSPPFVLLFMDDFYIFLSSIIHITCPKKRTSTGFFTKSVTVHTHASKWMFLCISPKFIFSFCTNVSLEIFLSTSLSSLPLLSSFFIAEYSLLSFFLFPEFPFFLLLTAYPLGILTVPLFSRIRFFPRFPV